jgi:preprotein translocase subunit SecE
MRFIKNFPTKIIRFLREVKIEMKRVNWLSAKQVRNYTFLVLAVSIAAGIYLGGLDIFFQWLLSRFIL